MINLLPITAKKNLKTEYNMRLAVVVLTAVLVIEALTPVFFFWSYFALSSNVKNLATQLAQKKQLFDSTNNEMPVQLSVITGQVESLRTPKGKLSIPLSQLIDGFLSSRPKGIEIKSLSYKTAKDVNQFHLSGLAETRESLLLFQNTLKSPLVKEIKFDKSFITEKPPIGFSVTILLK